MEKKNMNKVYYLPEMIESERLLIRVPMPGDGKLLYDAINDSYNELKLWLPWVNSLPSLEECEFTCKKAYAKFLLKEDLMLLLFLKKENILIGSSGLHDINWLLRRFEIGYWGRTGFLKNGLITEGVNAIVQYALTQLNANRIYLTVDDNNISSYKLAERIGFELEGHITFRSSWHEWKAT